MPKNIVLCLDGTNNEYGSRNTNVVRLYEALDTSRAESQVAFYDPGIGTFSASPVLGKPARFVMRVLGMAFGLGLTANLKEAYRFLMDAYEPGDKVYLFGFSRGAYTARVLAGLLHMCGLLHRGSDNLLDYAIRLYAGRDFRTAFGHRASGLAGFKATFSQRCPVHFLGVWDTVSTVGWIWDPASYPYTYKAHGVGAVRHAISLDERRAFFRQNRFKPHRRVREVWFAGVHSDVGGGYTAGTDGLARIPLEWMLVEARRAGLRLDDDRVLQAVEARAPLAAPLYTVHESLKHVWHAAEVFPKLSYSSRWKRQIPKLNLWSRRSLPDDVVVHESAAVRAEQHDYQLVGLPATHSVARWERYADEVATPARGPRA